MISVIKKVYIIKEYLDQCPSRITYGSIGNPNESTDSEAPEYTPYFDGAYFGDVYLWDYSALDKHQYRLDSLGIVNGLEIGDVLGSPIVQDLNTRAIKIFNQDPPFECKYVFPNIWTFIDDCALGKKYLEVACADREDDWYRLLKEVDIITD